MGMLAWQNNKTRLWHVMPYIYNDHRVGCSLVVLYQQPVVKNLQESLYLLLLITSSDWLMASVNFNFLCFVF